MQNTKFKTKQLGSKPHQPVTLDKQRLESLEAESIYPAELRI